jgi:MatE
MEDLTTGPLTRHLLKTTSFMLVTMIFQTLYFLIDLYWVGRLGTHAVAAVGIAGNFTFIVLALTQMLGVGTTTVVSHAVGRKNHDDAQLMFNQAQVLALGALGADSRTASRSRVHLGIWPNVDRDRNRSNRRRAARCGVLHRAQDRDRAACNGAQRGHARRRLNWIELRHLLLSGPTFLSIGCVAADCDRRCPRRECRCGAVGYRRGQVSCHSDSRACNHRRWIRRPGIPVRGGGAWRKSDLS